jgi:TM2 domain-containing membrane protein YozV
MFCPNCSSLLPNTATQCPHCLANVVPMAQPVSQDQAVKPYPGQTSAGAAGTTGAAGAAPFTPTASNPYAQAQQQAYGNNPYAQAQQQAYGSTPPTGQTQAYGQGAYAPQGQYAQATYEVPTANPYGQPTGNTYGNAQATQPTQPNPGYYQQPHAASHPVGRKNHIVAGLLAIFFGSLGVHKFYLGYSTPGLIMLLVTLIGSIFTFGLAALVMSIIGIIEGVIYLMKTDEEFYYTYELTTKQWF